MSESRQQSPSADKPDPFALAARIKTQGPAPVHLWDPPFCGDIDMQIRRDGTWYHEGKPIRRPAMVKLFSSILKREDDRYYLVTPVEKVGIQVEDCPFLIVAMEVQGSGIEQKIEFVSNIEERFTLSKEHPLKVSTAEQTGEPRPRVLVRGNLQALINRSVFYRLVDLAVEKQMDGTGVLGVWSEQEFFSLGPV